MPLEFDGVNGIIKNSTSDGDVTIKGNDGGSEISALTFDMSAEGVATFNKDIKIGDSGKAIFGAGSDLQIYHDGSNSYVEDSGTGALFLKTNYLAVQGANGNQLINAEQGAAVELYHNNAKKVETSSTGIDITGGFTATDGCTITTADNDPQLILTSTDADADEGPRMNFVRNSGSPANNDVLARISLQGKDAGANTTSYAELETTAVNVAEGSETGKFNIKVAVAGSVNQDVITMTGSEVVINDSSNDVDFRVEGNGDANLLFVDAGNDRIGVGTNSPAKLLSLKKDGGGGAIGIDIHNQGTNAADDALITFETQGHRNYSMGIDRSTSSFVVMSEADGLGTARITVNDDGKVGILNSSPGDFNDQGDHLVVGSGSGDTGITLYSGSGSGDSGNVFFADGTSGSDPVRGGITYKHDDNSMLFRVNDVNRLEIANGGATTITVADNSDTLTLVSTDADASSGPNLRLYRNSSSPANDDLMGTIEFEGRNDNSQDVVYAQMSIESSDVSDGTEDANWFVKVMSAGTLRNLLQLNASEVVFNQDSQDTNFRVESNDSPHMISVDAGNNNVGIGAAPTQAKLHIVTNDSGALNDANSDDFMIENTSATGMTIGSSNSGEGHIHFSDSDDADVGTISYFHASNFLNIRVNAADRLRIHSDGVAAFNNGIALGVGTANTASNVLDDYEEGTFSPALSGASGAPSGVNYSIRTGSYTKIGRLVTCHIYLALSSWSSGPSGDGIVTALPFTVRNDNDSYAAANIAYADGFISSDAPQTGYAVINTTKINLQTNQSSDSRDDLRTPVNAGNFSGDETIIITCSYHTDS